MKQLLDGFPVVVETPVAWGEMDAYQHVNNVAYFRYFENGRIAYLHRLDMWNYKEETGIGPILGSATCRFKIPLTYPDTVSVGTRIAEIGADRFTMQYRIVSHQHGAVAAEGEGVIVTYNYREGKKVSLPAEIKRRIQEIEGK